MRIELLLYVLIVTGETSWAAFVPLGPVFEDEMGLTVTQVGVLLGGASVAVLLVSPPAGILADRLGARRLTVAGTLLMGAAMVGHGLAPEFWSLLGARIVLGIGFGVLWSAGLAFLAQVVAPERRAPALGLAMTLAGVGVMAGPAYAGLLVEPAGTGWPFVGLGAVTLAAAAGLVLVRGPAHAGPREEEEPLPVRATARVMRREPLIVGALLCMAIPGFANNGVNLLLPLQLDDNGTSAAVTGLVYSASAGVFALGSAIVARRANRLATLTTGAAGALLLTALMVMPLVATASAVLIAFVLLRSLSNAMLFPIAMPLAVRGAERSGAGRGAVLGVLNAVWAGAAFLGPIAAGGLADLAGQRFTYGVLIGLTALAALWLARARAARPVPVD